MKNVNHLDAPSPVSYTRPSHGRGLSLVLATILLLLLFSHPLIHGDGLAHWSQVKVLGQLSRPDLRFSLAHVNWRYERESDIQEKYGATYARHPTRQNQAAHYRATRRAD